MLAVRTKSRREAQLAEGVISNLSLFRELSPKQLAAITARARLIHARRGTLLSRRGETLPGLFAVAYGLIKFALRSSNRNERVLRFVGPGDTYCEASALLGRPCPADALALTDTMAVCIAPDTVLSALDADPRFGRRIIALLADRMNSLVGEVESASMRRGVNRLAMYIESILAPAADGLGWMGRLPATKTAIAARLGMKKETLSRLLRELTDDGVISVNRREILVHDRERLSQIAAGLRADLLRALPAAQPAAEPDEYVRV